MTRLAAGWLGRVPYARAIALQERAVRERRSGAALDRLFLLEHPDVITLGRGSGPGHVLIAPEEAERLGVTVAECDRGGDVTYHGPGQLVGYPVVALEGERRDLHRYVRDLEGALIDAVATYGIRGERVPGRTGVWVGGEKLASIGVRVAGWVTSHGFALNVATDLSRFEWIVPCGIAGCGMTSIERLTGRAPGLPDVARRVAGALAERLGAPLAWDALGEASDALGASGLTERTHHPRPEDLACPIS